MPRNLVEKIYNNFGKGTVNVVEADKIDDGAAASSNNFLTEPDCFMLTYGRRRIGDEYAGSSPVLGLHSVTKLDGTAKGGVVVSVVQDLGIPVRYIGVGESLEDLLEFSPENFVDSLFS